MHWHLEPSRSLQPPRPFREEFARRDEHYSIGGICFLLITEYHPFIIGSKK